MVVYIHQNIKIRPITLYRCVTLGCTVEMHLQVHESRLCTVQHGTNPATRYCWYCLTEACVLLGVQEVHAGL